jgi:hypothetical protein
MLLINFLGLMANSADKLMAPQDLKLWPKGSHGCCQIHWNSAAGSTKFDYLKNVKTRNMWQASDEWNFFIVTDDNFINWNTL